MMREPPVDKQFAKDHLAPADGLGPQQPDNHLFAADPFDDRAEPFFELRDRLFGKPAGGEPGDGTPATPQGIIGILSPDAGDGRSHVAVNLAAALAHGGSRTLLIDGHLHQQRMHTLLQARARTVHDALCESQEVLVHRIERTHVLSLLRASSAASDPSILLEEPGLYQLVQHCRSRFECVVLDTPPASSTRDALLMAACCDIAVIVGRKGRTRMSDLKKLINRVSRSGVRVGGVVLNDH